MDVEQIAANNLWSMTKKRVIVEEVGQARFFYWVNAMTHPLIPEIEKLATPIADALGLEIVGMVFQTNYRPPVLRVDVRNPKTETSLEDCEQMSRALEAQLDAIDLIQDSYILEISSPGIPNQLTTDREFISFKGFPVLVKTEPPYRDKSEWRGKLKGRDERSVYLNQKGRAIAIPRDAIAVVQLDEQPETAD